MSRIREAHRRLVRVLRGELRREDREVREERAVGRPAAVIHPPIYGAGPFPCYDNFNRSLITMINPCAVKGISVSIFVAAI